MFLWNLQFLDYKINTLVVDFRPVLVELSSCKDRQFQLAQFSHSFFPLDLLIVEQWYFGPRRLAYSVTGSAVNNEI